MSELMCLGTSIGVADFNKNDTLKSIVKRVDNCLYEAKNSGRDNMITTLEFSTNI